MKIPSDPNDAQKKFLGEQAGERGGGFLEITELPTKAATPIMPRNIIPKSQLKHGAYYRGSCRNATVARWNANDQRFYYWRTKFGSTFLETICHREDDDIFDVFDAFEEIPNPTEEILFKEPK